LNILLLILGCLIDAIVILVILTPTLFTLITEVGIDPVHFGVVMTLNLMIGLLTPPVGMVIFVMMNLTGISLAEFTRECGIFILALIVVLILITYVPGLVTFPAGFGDGTVTRGAPAFPDAGDRRTYKSHVEGART